MSRQLKHTIVFLIATLLTTWIFYFQIVILKLNPYEGTGMLLLLLGGSAPSYIGFIMAMITYSKLERLNYIKRIYDVRLIKPSYWGIIVVLPIILIIISISLHVLLRGEVPEMAMLKDIIANPILWFPCILLSFMSGPFSEELGWRGFALGPLLERWGLVKASVILGSIWSIWHLPLYFMPETWHGKMGFQLTGFWTFIILSIGLSMIMSFFYMKTRRSILSAMLIHLSFNFSTQLISGSISPGYSARIELFRSLLVLAVGVVILTGKSEGKTICNTPMN